MAHPVGGNQAPVRHHRRGTQRYSSLHSNTLSNIVPALVIALISLAYLEEDGVLLSIALLAAAIVLAVATAVVWQTVVGAKWIIDLW